MFVVVVAGDSRRGRRSECGKQVCASMSCDTIVGALVQFRHNAWHCNVLAILSKGCRFDLQSRTLGRALMVRETDVFSQDCG